MSKYSFFQETFSLLIFYFKTVLLKSLISNKSSASADVVVKGIAMGAGGFGFEYQADEIG